MVISLPSSHKLCGYFVKICEHNPKIKINQCLENLNEFYTQLHEEADISSWCIADQQIPDDVLQRELDWACSHGADCSKIQPTQECFKPNTVRAHASYAFNSYYQKQKHKDHNSCLFRYAAVITEVNPSHGSYMEWCIADQQMPDDVLQRELNWACSNGADCSKIQPNQVCFKPNTVRAHASYAFNSYYQKQKHKDHNSCLFRSAAFITEVNPSHGSCKFEFLP
ncbi:glucan endo-1,3-beta-glucosidase 4-like [Impatiens glandulifera]|uniref:glucan endo-1,3-beta-glucosidase 4-like n=1 Tax=Impatiens glandulifera TaxID=253017 RepID=UPI001FB11567|nr:glucan endo-1,3-beta-glucosidase 4-like [Impatiens glandulifera]